MKIDSEGSLRHLHFKGGGGSLYLGDVGDALLRGFGAHEPPIIVEEPRFDQQCWKMIIKDSELTIILESKAYWGFGLFSSCFLNKIHMIGPLNRRASTIFDLVSVLGRNPWEAVRKSRFSKNTGVQITDEKAAWEELIEQGKLDLENKIQSMEMNAKSLKKKLTVLSEDAPKNWDLNSAHDEIENALSECEVANDALHDRTSAGVERALARAENHLIKANPETEVVGQYDGGDLLDQMIEVDPDEIDLSEKILLHDELPDDFVHNQDSLEDDDVPFVDLSSEEE